MERTHHDHRPIPGGSNRPTQLPAGNPFGLSHSPSSGGLRPRDGRSQRPQPSAIPMLTVNIPQLSGSGRARMATLLPPPAAEKIAGLISEPEPVPEYR